MINTMYVYPKSESKLLNHGFVTFEEELKTLIIFFLSPALKRVFAISFTSSPLQEVLELFTGFDTPACHTGT
jgi:hypothetical protein